MKLTLKLFFLKREHVTVYSVFCMSEAISNSKNKIGRVPSVPYKLFYLTDSVLKLGSTVINQHDNLNQVTRMNHVNCPDRNRRSRLKENLRG